MTEQAKSAEISKVAFSPTFHNRQNVIGIPQRLAGEPLKPPFSQKPQPVGPARAAQLRVGKTSVDSADCADAPVPLQNLLAKVARVGAEAPFVNAPIRAERETPRRDFETAPAAEGPAAGPFRQSGAVGETARHGPRSAQTLHNIFSIKCLGGFCSLARVRHLVVTLDFQASHERS